MSRPVYIAGRGAISAYGVGVPSLVDGILSGERGVGPRVRTGAFEAPTRVAGEFPAACFPDEHARLGRGGRGTGQLSFLAALRAAREAFAEASVDPGIDPGVDPRVSARPKQESGAPSKRAEMGLILATTKADLAGVIGAGEGYGLPARLTERIAVGLGILGPRSSVSTACASGVTAIAMAERRIALGELDRVLVVGVDTINEFIMAGFGSMGILDPDPCRPFDASRAGISLGDGAGAVLLTSCEHESIGARITGHGGANDATTVTGCHKMGLGVTLATRRALLHAGCDPGSIDLIHLHGTGTKASDFSEATGLGETFEGDTSIACGTKGQTGHTLGAAGVLETLIALGCLERARVPTNAGLVEPNVDPRLSLSRGGESLQRARCALKVSGGFGGIQQAVVIEI